MEGGSVCPFTVAQIGEGRRERKEGGEDEKRGQGKSSRERLASADVQPIVAISNTW
jgi:hypothetical protein